MAITAPSAGSPVMITTRFQLLQVYARWLADPRSNQALSPDTLSPILSRLAAYHDLLDAVAAAPSVFIDARVEDALLALSSLAASVGSCGETVWSWLLFFAKYYPQWRTLGDRQGLLKEVLFGLLMCEIQEKARADEIMEILRQHAQSMPADPVSLDFVMVFCQASQELARRRDARPQQLMSHLAHRFMSMFVGSKDVFCNPKVASANQLLLKCAMQCTDTETFSFLLQASQDLLCAIKVKSDPPPALVDLYREVIEFLKRSYDLIPTSSNIDTKQITALPTEMLKYASETVYTKVLEPSVGLIAHVLDAEQSLALINQLKPILDELGKRNLTLSPASEHASRLIGELLGCLMRKGLGDSAFSSVFFNDMKISLDLQEAAVSAIAHQPSDFYLPCPAVLPIFGSVCRVLSEDDELVSNCLSAVSQCFSKGSFGEKSRVFFDQMIAIAAADKTTSNLNRTLDIMCRVYLEMEGLDGASAALSSAFEHLVQACSTDSVKAELVTLSLLGLYVQKGVKLVTNNLKDSSRRKSTTALNYLTQPPTAILELLLPAVASGIASLPERDCLQSISHQSFVELMQEFWFVSLFIAFQPLLKWPDSWRHHLTIVAVHSPILVKERDRGAPSTNPLSLSLLTLPLTPTFTSSYLSGRMVSCAERLNELDTAQCLWLAAVDQSESLRICATDVFESLVRYISDDIVADLRLSEFVNDLSLGIVREWLRSRSQAVDKGVLVDLVVQMVALLGNIHERIHDAGIYLLRFLLSHDERLMGEERVWEVLFGKLHLLSALRSHEPNTRLELPAADDQITDAQYAERVFEDVLAFFRSVAAAAVRLCPDGWSEWIMVGMVPRLNDPKSPADSDFLLDDLMRSMLLDRVQPRRSTEGPSLDASRQLAHHLDWSLKRAVDGSHTDDIGNVECALKESISEALANLKECLRLTDSWSSLIRRHPERLFPIIAELGIALSAVERRSSLPSTVFMHKITMSPSVEVPVVQLPTRPLCLANLIAFLGSQLHRHTFSAPRSVAIFALLADISHRLAIGWPRGHGRRLVVFSVLEYSLRVLSQQVRVFPGTPATAALHTKVFLFAHAFYEQLPVDTHMESQRVLQREVDLLKSCISLLRQLLPKIDHTEVTGLFITFLKHDLLRISALLNRRPAFDDIYINKADIARCVSTAASISIPLAVAFDTRMPCQDPSLSMLKDTLARTVAKNPWSLFSDPASTPNVVEAVLQCGLDGGDDAVPGLVIPASLLHFLPPCTPLTALAIFRRFANSPRWLNYAMRSLESFPPSLLFFYAPQIIQALRQDKLGYITATILHIARTDSKLAHQIIWNAQANQYIDDLGTIADPMKAQLEALIGQIVGGLSDGVFYEREFRFFQRVTGISGTLKSLVKKEKWEKKKKIDEELRKIAVDPGVYLPSSPESTVIDIDYDSGRPLQSQAKAPFMATFKVNTAAAAVDHGNSGSSSSGNHGRSGNNDDNGKGSCKDNGGGGIGLGATAGSGGNSSSNSADKWQSAIFKVGDDCRQDVMALQFIAAAKTILQSSAISGYLFPYRVVATAPGCGVIEVIPHSISRDQLGREKINSLFGYFSFKFGSTSSARFGTARSAFVRSTAAYSVLCYLLAIRDRHNGNIMVSDAGHLIHIDFGFVLDIAPGGIRFESAPFKFTSEMLQVLGGREGAAFGAFQELCVQCFLGLRPYGGQLVRMIEQMADAGLPCFAHNADKAIRNLRWRFRLDVDEWEARQHMEDLVSQSCENVSTVLYDSYQHNRNGIPY